MILQDVPRLRLAIAKSIHSCAGTCAEQFRPAPARCVTTRRMARICLRTRDGTLQCSPCPQASSWIEKFCWLPQAELAKAHKSRQELQHRMRNVVSSFNEAAQGVEERKRRMKERRKMVRRR